MTDPAPGERRAAALRGGDAWRPADPRYPSITCPVCGATSYHPEDKRQGYCAICQRFTSPPDGSNPGPVS